MKKVKKARLFKIFSLIVAISVAVWANGGFSFDLNNTAHAVGDLTIDWGVPSGNPIFMVSNMAPGDTESRNVLVTNEGTAIRAIGVRGEWVSEIGDLGAALEFTVSQGATDLYGGASPTGPKTLSEFFTDSSAINGIFLSNLAPSAAATYTFTATFKETSGNEFQNTQVVFDLIIGISVDVPAECADIEFSGDPIFGTSGSDSLNGTPGNDLIFGLEGSDSIKGNNGDDCIVGGENSDSLKGNEGDDVLLGQGGTDSLKGNNGDDKLYGGEGTDSLDGGNGLDYLDGAAGPDSLQGGNQNDILLGGSEGDSLKGGNGDDNLDGGPGVDSLKGNAGIDTCTNGEAVSSCEL